MACAKTADTAILFVHGIGEPSPLITLLALVEGLLATELKCGDSRIRRVPVPFQPIDQRYMLVVTTGEGARFDFYEHYWAPHTTGQQLSVLLCWLLRLALQPAGELAPAGRAGVALLRVWFLSLIASVVLLVGQPLYPLSWSPSILAAVVWTGLSITALQLLVPLLGDAACYLLAKPSTVTSARRIESDFQKTLIRLQAMARYQKIVIIGHSLGSVIAYHGLCELFQRANCGADLPWCSKIQTLVTIGSPLAHAPLILASTKLSWRRRLQLGFERTASKRPGTLFGEVAWHNLYDPVQKQLSGDPVGGALARHFGKGVSDHSMKMPFRGFTHSKYWCGHRSGNPHQQLLRQLIGLSGR